MKVCFFRHSLFNRGGDKMVVAYANFLHEKSHEVAIIANRVSTVFPVHAAVHRISSGSSKLETILAACMKKIGYDVIIADIIMMAFFLSIRNRKRVLYFAQDYDESYYTNRFMRYLVRFVYVYCLRWLKIPVIAVSYELADVLRKRYGAEATVVANGVDEDIFYSDITKQYLDLKLKKKAVLVFMRSDHRKGFDISMKVLSAFQGEIEAGALVVWAVGEDIETPFPVKKFGFVAPDDLRRILSCADVLLYPSRHEGMPLFVLEAMACGCPVVTTEAVHFVKNGIDALQCGIGDIETLIAHLHRMLSDENTRSEVVKNAYATARKYDMRRSMHLFEARLLRCQMQ